MERPIVNPPNPYVGTMRVFPGTMIRISGKPKPNATRFAINLQTGPSLNPRDDLALHLSPCFQPPRVVRNSLHYGAWGLEEAWGNGTIVNPHHPFEIIILTEPDQFKIAINGAHYCEFKHRISYHEITHLTIDGDVDIDRIIVTNSTQQSTSQAYHPSAPVPAASNTGAPYPTGNTGMPMPSFYPTLPSGGPQPMSTSASGIYPSAGAYPSLDRPPQMPQGPTPAGNTYMSGYPGHSAPYPAQSGPYPGQAGTYPGQTGTYPAHPHQQPQAGHSSSSPFSSLPIGGKALGTLAGLGLGAAAGAAVLSAANPLKHMKKMIKPKKMFKHKGYGRSSSSSSNSSISSRSSFSSNSS